MPALVSALHHIRGHAGALPPNLISKEDKNSVGPCAIPPAVIDGLKERFAGLPQRRVVIIDGFLLFAQSMAEVRALFDVKLFLRTNYATAKTRREGRSGYVTLEGFWEDPPGYVDQIVWPNYVKDHAFLFEKGDVEAPADDRVCGDLGIEVMPEAAKGNMAACLEWACGILERELDGER